MTRRGISFEQIPGRMREMRSVRTLRQPTKRGDTELLIEPAMVFGVEGLQGLIDQWIIPAIAERVVHDLISSGEHEEQL
jgi:hypothetical protein